MKRLLKRQHPIILVVLLLTCSSGQITGDFNQEKNCSDLKAGDKGFIQLAKENEPGEPLIVSGKVIGGKDFKPIEGAYLFLYQTDSSGIYNTSGGPDNEARIRGTVQTNESGCFKIKTILPGDYPGQKNSRHLHYVVNAEGYKESKSILFFKGFTTANITGEGRLSVLDIKKENGTWIGSIDLSIERADNLTR